MCSHIDHTYAGKFVISEAFCQWDSHSHKGYGLLAHPEDSPEKTEKKHYEGNDYITYAKLADEAETLEILYFGDELQYAFIHCLGTVHDPECASDDKYEGNDAGLLAESFIESGEDLPGLGVSSGDKPGGNCTDEQDGEDDDVCVRNFEFWHKR